MHKTKVNQLILEKKEVIILREQKKQGIWETGGKKWKIMKKTVRKHGESEGKL